MPQALTNREPALLGNTMDMTPPEKMGYEYGQEGQIAELPAIQGSAKNRRQQMMTQFQDDLAAMEAQIDDALGGNPAELDIDSELYHYSEDSGRYQYKDIFYKRALGYVPLKPELLSSEENKIVNDYMQQERGRLIAEKNVKMQMKQQQVDRFVDMFKEVLRQEQEMSEIEEVQKKREVARRQQEVSEQRKKAEEERKKSREQRQKESHERKMAKTEKPEMTRTQALKEIARVQKLMNSTYDEKELKSYREYVKQLRTFLRPTKKTKPKESQESKRKKAIYLLKHNNAPVTERNIKYIMDNM